MSRSLSLTDLHNQLAPPPLQTSSSRDEFARTEAYHKMSRPRQHQRAYTSDDEYTTTAARRQREVSQQSVTSRIYSQTNYIVD